MKRKTILFFSPNISTFIQRDIELLSSDYQVKIFNLNQGSPLKLIPQLFKQLLFLIKNFRSADISICFFAGYNSVLPVIFKRCFKLPTLIIVGGTDAARFPKINYGSYVKRLNGMATAFSLRHCNHIIPVHESLVYQKYTYDDAGAPEQGYTVFAKKTKNVPFTPIYFGFDSQFFKANENNRKPLTFITVGNLQHKSLYIRKGYDLIIELARKRPELSFTLVGWDGKTHIDVPKNVQLLPYMNQTEVKTAFTEHEFYFQLSVMEGMPNALCEAMLCGCIPIGSNVSGIPFVIGDTGYILEQRNIDKLDNLIKNILSNDNRKALSKAARERIKENFTYYRRQKELSEIIELYTK